MIKVGFIGAGDIAYLHGEGVQSSSNAELYGIWNRTRSKAEEKASIFDSRVFDSPEDLIEAVDVVYVLTNMETHHAYCMQAIEAGKHVLVEKPTAVTIEEIEEIKAFAHQKGVQVAPVHNYLYEAPVMRAKELIESGKLGDLVSIYVLYNIHHPEEVAARYPGVIRQILTHHAYCTLYLVGQPQLVSCMKATVNDGSVPQENLAMVTMKMHNNALSHRRPCGRPLDLYDQSDRHQRSHPLQLPGLGRKHPCRGSLPNLLRVSLHHSFRGEVFS